VKQAMRFPHVNRWFSSFLDNLEVPAVLLAPLLALLLAVAMFLPNWFARTSWSKRNMEIIDSPAGYVGFLSLWGCIVCVALVIGVWQQRWAWLAMLVAAGGFAGAAVVCIGYWQQLRLGLALVDGRERMPERWAMQSPPALPLFIIAATVGFVSALVLARGCWHARHQE
jgi:hypothetical protein